MKKTFIYSTIVASSLLTISCNDFLDLEPITSVSTATYFYAEADLAAYSANFYTDSYAILPSHGSGNYNLGLFKEDNGTDNQTADSPGKLFVPGQTRVGDYDQWASYFKQIRAINYFLVNVERLYENKEIKGSDNNIRHYLGEMYFFRAYVYYKALKNIGDFPILTEILPDDYEAVREASKRRPRNQVARFILSDLDKAYELMLSQAPVSNRLNKDCAALVKSRVALFEGTWEKYHKGTAFVPGGNGWPGAAMDYNSGLSIDTDSESKFFLQQAVEAADIVAAGHTLNANYAALFNSVNLNGISEILLWRQYSLNSAATSHHWVVSYLQRNGAGNTGYTRSFVNSYLMADGTPIYAAGSNYQGDDTYEHLFANRDPRMDQTILKTGDLLSDNPNFAIWTKSDGKGYFYRPQIFEGQVENGNPTGYCLRKGLNTAGDMQPTRESYTGCPVFRAAEAYLNYIEAYYELNGTLGGKCSDYWQALRRRAGMSTDYQATINATDMSMETLDWGSYSAGKQVNATLYNIRRERRVELASEGFRLDDLRRWRALDQVKNVHLEGFNFWDANYKLYTEPKAEDAQAAIDAITLIEYGSGTGTANISAKSEGPYLRPYRKNTANIGFNGLTWNTAKYLNPISNKEFRLTTAVEGSSDYDSSTIYQNPGWTKADGSLPEGES